LRTLARNDSRAFPFTANTLPDVALRAVTFAVIAIIRQVKEIQTGNPAKVAELIESKSLPPTSLTCRVGE
jgi:hypothetical protein